MIRILKLSAAAAILAAVLCLLYILIGNFFYRMAIDAHSEKWFLKAPKKKKKLPL